MRLVTPLCFSLLFSIALSFRMFVDYSMTEINPDAELRHKIHHMIETMDKEEYTFVVLTKGYRAIIDRKFFPHIKPYRWHTINPPNQLGSAYARTTQIKRGKTVGLHNFVMSLYLHGKYDPSVTQVSFNNKLTLDCRLVNLMKNTGRQAAMRNRKGKSNSTSQFKGVRLLNGKWRGQIMDGKIKIHLGTYQTEEYAAKVYDAAAWILFGSSAYYNFSIGTPTHSHRETASAYIERHLNKQRQKPLREDERITLGLDVENLQNDS